MFRGMMMAGLNNNRGIDFGGKTVVFAGDSMTTGFGLTTPSTQRWPAVLSASSNAIENNIGVVGATMVQNVCDRDWFKVANVPTKTTTYGKVFLAYGGNDVMINTAQVTVGAFKAALRVAVDAIVAKGWSASDIVIIDSYYLDTLNDAVGECGVTAARSRAEVNRFAYSAQEVAGEKGTALIKMYDYTQSIARGYTDGLHYDAPTAKLVADFIKRSSFAIAPPVAVDTLLTGATRLAPSMMTALGNNIYARSSGNLEQELGKSLSGNGFIANQYLADTGVSHYLFKSDYSAWNGYQIEQNGTVTIDSNSQGEVNVPAPLIGEFIILGRFNGSVQLRYGTTLENSIVIKDFGIDNTLTVVSINSNTASPRLNLNHPQGQNLA